MTVPSRRRITVVRTETSGFGSAKSAVSSVYEPPAGTETSTSLSKGLAPAAGGKLKVWTVSRIVFPLETSSTRSPALPTPFGAAGCPTAITS